MSRISFLLDEHIPHAIAHALRRRGIDVLTAPEAGLRTEADEQYVQRARRAGHVIVTNDPDFLRLHGRLPHAGIVFCAQGTRSISQMIASLLLIAEVLDAEDMMGRVEYI